MSQHSDHSPRARDLGIALEGVPGPLNGITDVGQVEVGHTTLIRGDGPLQVGTGPVRTGVTAILPRGKGDAAPVFAGWFSLNGNGEMTGTTWIEESGLLESPVILTNTHSVGVARDAVIAWSLERNRLAGSWGLPVVAETYDGWLNDINGFHVKPDHVFAALDNASPGPVAEGNVGGGTGMICHEFKGGIGTSSRRWSGQESKYMAGALVQANHGMRHQLRIAGAPVGLEIPIGSEEQPVGSAGPGGEAGSIIIVLATDAPLLPHQCKALARRAALGLARTGSVAGIGSGDLFLAFSTANLAAGRPLELTSVQMLGLTGMSALFEAAVQATEEAIINALLAARTMTGMDNHVIPALPHARLLDILRRYGRLEERPH